MALHFYKLAGQPLTRDLLKKVASRITHVELSDTVVDIVVALFDENGVGFSVFSLKLTKKIWLDKDLNTNTKFNFRTVTYPTPNSYPS